MEGEGFTSWTAASHQRSFKVSHLYFSVMRSFFCSLFFKRTGSPAPSCVCVENPCRAALQASRLKLASTSRKGRGFTLQDRTDFLQTVRKCWCCVAFTDRQSSVFRSAVQRGADPQVWQVSSLNGQFLSHDAALKTGSTYLVVWSVLPLNCSFSKDTVALKGQTKFEGHNKNLLFCHFVLVLWLLHLVWPFRATVRRDRTMSVLQVVEGSVLSLSALERHLVLTRAERRRWNGVASCQ